MLKKMAAALCLLSVTSFVQARDLLPDLKTATYPLNDRRIDTSTIPGKVLLRFSNGVANVGEGRLEIRGGTIFSNGTREVYQRIFNTNGGFTDHLAGVFIYHPAHNHIHFENFAYYKLRQIIGTDGV